MTTLAAYGPALRRQGGPASVSRHRSTWARRDRPRAHRSRGASAGDRRGERSCWRSARLPGETRRVYRQATLRSTRGASLAAFSGLSQVAADRNASRFPPSMHRSLGGCPLHRAAGRRAPPRRARWPRAHPLRSPHRVAFADRPRVGARARATSLLCGRGAFRYRQGRLHRTPRPTEGRAPPRLLLVIFKVRSKHRGRGAVSEHVAEAEALVDVVEQAPEHFGIACAVGGGEHRR